MNLKESVEEASKAHRDLDGVVKYALGFFDGVSILGSIILAIEGHYVTSMGIAGLATGAHHSIYLGYRKRNKKGGNENADVRI